MRRVSVMFLALCLTACAAEGPVSEGAAAFDQGDLDAAVAAWSVPLADGSASGLVHYNLGVASYRRGAIDRAIAHWRVAQIHRPRDPSIAHNLAFARVDVEGLPEPPAAPAPWLQLFTVGELALGGSGLLGIGSLGLLVVWWRRRPWLPWAVIWVLGLLIGGLGLYGSSVLAASPLAVIVDAEAQVRDTAAVDGEVRFKLAPGSEVIVENTLGDYLLVRTGSGRRGWVPSSAAIVIHPASRGEPGYPP